LANSALVKLLWRRHDNEHDKMNIMILEFRKYFAMNCIVLAKLEVVE